MTAIRKFLFDIDFAEPRMPDPTTAANAEEADAEELTEAEAAQELTEEDVLPTFSEDEVNAARDAGFKAGKEAGLQEAAGSMERQVSEALTHIGERLDTLFGAQRKSVEDLRVQAVKMAGALTRKVLPGWSEREGLGEIKRLAGELLERLRSEPRVVFAVNDSLRDTVTQTLATIVDNRGIDTAVEVVGDPNIAIGDCRLEWSDGGAERNTAALIEEIDTIIARNTGNDGDTEPMQTPEVEEDGLASPEVGAGQTEGSPETNGDEMEAAGPAASAPAEPEIPADEPNAAPALDVAEADAPEAEIPKVDETPAETAAIDDPGGDTDAHPEDGAVGAVAGPPPTEETLEIQAGENAEDETGHAPLSNAEAGENPDGDAPPSDEVSKPEN